MVHDPPPQYLPTTTMQLAGHGISEVTGRLTPAGLGVLLLIVCGLAASTYFLRILILGQQEHLDRLLAVQQGQIELVLKTHDREFDALVSMVREFEAMPPAPPPSLTEDMPLPLPRP